MPYQDRKSTRLNSSHGSISYAVFCLKKKKKNKRTGLGTLSGPDRAQLLSACVSAQYSVPLEAAQCPVQPLLVCFCYFFFFFNDTATTEISPLSLPDALPISTSASRSSRFSRNPSGVRCEPCPPAP